MFIYGAVHGRGSAIQIANMACELCCASFLLVLLLALITKRDKPRSVQCVELVYAGEFISTCMNLVARLEMIKGHGLFLLYVNYVVSYAATVLIVCSLYWYLLATFEERGAGPFSLLERRIIVPFSFAMILAFVILINTDWLSGQNMRGIEWRTHYYLIVTMAALPIFAVSFVRLWQYRKLLKTSETVLILVYCAVPVLASIMDTLYNTAAFHVTMTLVSCLLYVGISVEQERELDKKERELAVSQLNSMVQRINPHFVCNTLGSIDSLCRTDPAAAQRLIAKFSDYMRDNYADMTDHPMISIDKELEHLDHYIGIEQVRFPNLNVVYDIQARGFVLPSLTIQPLAENAVKHGICRRRRSAGTLTVSTRETEEDYVIRVEDDGVGFRPGETDGHGTHVAIENVRRRLDMLCGGTLTVESRENVGTTCEIRIPRGGGET